MAEEATASGNESCSTENVTIIAETFSEMAPSTTLSSVQSEVSTEQLICKTPQSPKSRPKQRIDTKSASVESPTLEKARSTPETCSKSILTSLHSDASIRDSGKRSKIILYLGMAQLTVGVALIVTGGLVIIHGSALGRTGAGLWSGCLAVATGVLGILAGINDCYGLYERRTSRMGSLFLTLFLALSLIALAAGNLAAVLAGTGLLRDVRRPAPSSGASQSEQDEYEEKFWPPILANVGLLLSSSLHCLFALISVYHTAKRVCSCFRPREPFNHNQFDPNFVNVQHPYSVMSVSEKVHDKESKYHTESPINNMKDLNKILESKLAGSDADMVDGPEERKLSQEVARDSHAVGSYFGSANSKDKLVCSWLGGQPGVPVKPQKVSKSGVKKNKMKQGPVLLYPANAGNTMTRAVPVSMVQVPSNRLGYATLPMMPSARGHPLTRPMAPPPPHLLYPPVYAPYSVDMLGRVKRKTYANSSPGIVGQKRNNQLTRSLERIYRQRKPSNEDKTLPKEQKVKKMKKKSKPVTEADVIRTYTGLDRTIAEQFINACNENRHHTDGHDQTKHSHKDKSDSSGFDTASSGSNKY